MSGVAVTGDIPVRARRAGGGGASIRFVDPVGHTVVIDEDDAARGRRVLCAQTPGSCGRAVIADP
jgi:hypothetical protein